MNNAFTLLLTPLFKAYGIDVSTQNSEQDSKVYTLTVDNDLEIHLVGQQEGYLNLVCYLDESLEKLDSAHLFYLLLLNDFSLEHPAFHVGFNQKKELVISCRQPLHELDSAKLYQLTELFIDRVVSLQSWVQSAHTPKPTRTEHHATNPPPSQLSGATIK